MQRIIRIARETDPIAVEWLVAIDAFDKLVARRAPLETLARVAARMSSRSVGVDDSWNGRRVELIVGSGPSAGSDDAGHAEALRGLIAAIAARRLKGGRAMVVRTGSVDALAASIDVAGGRIGSVWMIADKRPWTSIDQLVLARLSNAAAIDAISTHAEQLAKSRVDTGTVERLLGSAVSEAEASEAGRRAQLPTAKSYVAVAVKERPTAAASPEAIAQTVARAVERRGLIARPAVVSRAAALVVEYSSDLAAAFDDLAAAAKDRGFSLDFGVGEPGDISRIHRSWTEAREALALLAVAAAGEHVANFRDLGVLHVLAQLPLEDVSEFPDFRRLLELQENRAGPNDLEILEAYLGCRSLRKTAAQVYLHFSSVEYRLRHIEQALGVSLADPTDRFRIEVALKLVRIHQAIGA